MQKQKPVKNLQELRLKISEKFAALENEEITVQQAMGFAAMAKVMISCVRVEMYNNEMKGIVQNIDFLDIAKPSVETGMLIDEFKK